MEFATTFEINGYNLYRNARIGRVAEGVIIHLKITITSDVCSEVKSDVNSESIKVELINGREKLIIGNLYTPPNLSREASTLLFQEINAAAK